VVPSPRVPSSFRPHVHRVPSDLIAAETLVPCEICVHVLDPMTVGVDRDVVVPSPKRPESLNPHADMVLGTTAGTADANIALIAEKPRVRVSQIRTGVRKGFIGFFRRGFGG
jgi:hypothetical protein